MSSLLQLFAFLSRKELYFQLHFHLNEILKNVFPESIYWWQSNSTGTLQFLWKTRKKGTKKSMSYVKPSTKLHDLDLAHYIIQLQQDILSIKYPYAVFQVCPENTFFCCQSESLNVGLKVEQKSFHQLPHNSSAGEYMKTIVCDLGCI